MDLADFIADTVGSASGTTVPHKARRAMHYAFITIALIGMPAIAYFGIR